METEPTLDSEKVDPYADLLNRFERLLAYASTLQTRLRRFERQEQGLERLVRENSRLKARIGLDDIYIALLEQALEAAGMLAGGGQLPESSAVPEQSPAASVPVASAEPRLRLAGAPHRRVAPRSRAG